MTRDFDRAEIGAVRTMNEAEHWFKRQGEIAGRPVVYDRYRDKVKATYNRLMMRKGEEEL